MYYLVPKFSLISSVAKSLQEQPANQQKTTRHQFSLTVNFLQSTAIGCDCDVVASPSPLVFPPPSPVAAVEEFPEPPPRISRKIENKFRCN